MLHGYCDWLSMGIRENTRFGKKRVQLLSILEECGNCPDSQLPRLPNAQTPNCADSMQARANSLCAIGL